jgi:hypothetical protein
MIMGLECEGEQSKGGTSGKEEGRKKRILREKGPKYATYMCSKTA